MAATLEEAPQKTDEQVKLSVTMSKQDAARIRSEVLAMRREALDSAQAAYKIRKQLLEFAQRTEEIGRFLDLIID